MRSFYDDVLSLFPLNEKKLGTTLLYRSTEVMILRCRRPWWRLCWPVESTRDYRGRGRYIFVNLPGYCYIFCFPDKTPEIKHIP